MEASPQQDKEIGETLFAANIVPRVRREAEQWQKLQPGRSRTTQANALAVYVVPLCDTVDDLRREVDALRTNLRLAAVLISPEELRNALAGVLRLSEAADSV